MVSANRLRELRLKEGITIAELSRAAKLSPKTAAKCERSLGSTSLTTRNRLVNALNELARGEHYGFSDVFPVSAEALPSKPAAKDDFVVTEAMRRNCAWAVETTEDLTPYEGKWVAICDGRIVASGETLGEALDNAASAGHAGEETLLEYLGEDNFIY